MSPLCCWHCVYLWPNTAWDCSQWGWKVPASSCLVSLDRFWLRICAWRTKSRRTKHLAPDTGRPVTHLVDRSRDRGKDRWMENSKAGGGGGGGAIDTVGFGGREEEKTRIMCLPERQEKEGMHLSRWVNIVDSLLILLFPSWPNTRQWTAYHTGTTQ